MLFRVFRDEQEGRWVVLVGDQRYGGELSGQRGSGPRRDRGGYRTRASGNEAEVWDQSQTLRLY